MSSARRCAALLLLLTMILATRGLRAQDTGPDSRIARQILEAAGGVKPGEVVFVDGGIHIFPLMEEIAAQVYLAGGQPMFGIGTDRLGEVGAMQMDPDHFAARDSAFSAFYDHAYGAIRIHIRLPFHAELDDLLRRFRADSARFAKAQEGRRRSDPRLIQARHESGIRLVQVNYPLRDEHIASIPMERAVFDKMMLDAVLLDNVELDRVARAVAHRLNEAKSIRITSAAGTDVRASLGQHRAVVTSGYIPPELRNSELVNQRTAYLPGGAVRIVPADGTGDGRIVVPRQDCRGTTVSDFSMDVRQGRAGNIQAKSGSDCIMTNFGNLSGPAKHFGGIHIGLNPALKFVDEGRGYYPELALGVVHLAFGFNLGIGGGNSTSGWWFPVVNPTIEVDGHMIMKDGKLAQESGGTSNR